MDWIIENKDWFLSGMGVTIIIFLLKLFSNKEGAQTPTVSQSVVITNNNNAEGIGRSTAASHTKECMSLPDRKAKTRILFIDDDTKFKVVKILSSSGWINTSIIKDAKTLEEPSIVNADILFVDVQGVGVTMGFDSEGLGLALALKEKYPEKKVVIYSAETKGDRFHEALRKADSFLPKNADPYEFQKLVEELSSGLGNLK